TKNTRALLADAWASETLKIGLLSRYDVPTAPGSAAAPRGSDVRTIILLKRSSERWTVVARADSRRPNLKSEGCCQRQHPPVTLVRDDCIVRCFTRRPQTRDDGQHRLR